MAINLYLQFFWKIDESGQGFGHFDPCEMLFAGFAILHHHRQIQAEVGDVGEGMARIDGEGCENRKNLLLEIVVQVGALFLIEIDIVKDANAMRL